MISRSANDVRGRIQALRIWQLTFTVFAVALAVYVPTAHANSLDVVSADFASWQLATEHSRVFDPAAFPQLDDHPMRDIWIVKNAAGKDSIGRAPGTIAASLPAYWVSQPDHRTDVPGQISAAVLTAAAMALLFSLLARHINRVEALTVTGIVAFGTPVWSVAADGMWPHTLTVLGIAGMARSVDRQRWWSAGFFGGIALWGRLHVAVICALVGLYLAWRRREWIIVVKMGLASSAMLGAQCAWTRWFYGTWNPMAGYRAGDFTDYAARNLFDPVNQLGFWISPDRGVLVWTPVILLLVPALIRSWRQLPDWSRALLIAGLVYTIIQGVFNRFSGGSAFWPYRLGLEVVVAAVPALALSMKAMGPVARRIWPHVVIVQTTLIAVGALGLISMPEVDGTRPELRLQLITVAAFIAVGAAVYRWASWTVKREEVA